MLTLQCAPAARLEPQLLEDANWVFGEMVEIAKEALPVLVSVTVWLGVVVPTVTLPNESDVGERLATGPPVALEPPVPLRPTVCGLPVALSETVSVPLKDPVVAGVKVTLMLQFAPAATEDPQLLVSEKS